MTNFFNYSTSGSSKSNSPAPLYPDFDSKSIMSQKMLRAKSVNDGNYWTTMREVFLHDFNTLPKNRFKVWTSVMSVPFMTRNNIFDYVSVVMEAVRKDERYKVALEDPMIGYGSQEDFAIYSLFGDFNTTMNRIQHMAHLINCGYTLDKLASLNTILEFGAGIGEMAEIIYKLGFKGKYVIYDFPEVSNIQRYFHQQLKLNDISYTGEYNDLTSADLCIGTWSFTEMPIDLRNEIMYNVVGSKEWLLAYSNNIFGIDNDSYIKNVFLPNYMDQKIDFIDIPSMPWDGGARYVTVKPLDK